MTTLIGRSLEESRDDLQTLGYDTPALTIRSDWYTTLLDATDQPLGDSTAIQQHDGLKRRVGGIASSISKLNSHHQEKLERTTMFKKLSLHVVLAACFAGLILGFALTTRGATASASPDPQQPNAEPAYCTGQILKPAKVRQNGKDAIQPSASFTCDQPQFVEWIYTVTRQGYVVANGDVAAVVGGAGCGGPTNPCGRVIQGAVSKLSSGYGGRDTFTVTATVKVWTATTGFCQGANCYPFGTPLRTFDLEPLSVVM